MFCERFPRVVRLDSPAFWLARMLMKLNATNGHARVSRNVRPNFIYMEGYMADEKNKDQNQGSQRDEKAMGATATSGAQGQQPDKPSGQSGQQGQSQQNIGRSQQESAGQGGGIQGQGQRNPSQGQDKSEGRGEDFRPTGG